MNNSGQEHSVSQVVAAASGVVIIRVTVLDECNVPVEPQPKGCFQVWLVIGDVRMLFAGDDAAAVSHWFEDGINKVFYKLESEEIPEKFLEEGFEAHTISDTSGVQSCRVDLIDLRGQEPVKMTRQLIRSDWKCVISLNHPELYGGITLELNKKASSSPGKRSLRVR